MLTSRARTIRRRCFLVLQASNTKQKPNPNNGSMRADPQLQRTLRRLVVVLLSSTLALGLVFAHWAQSDGVTDSPSSSVTDALVHNDFNVPPPASSVAAPPPMNNAPAPPTRRPAVDRARNNASSAFYDCGACSEPAAWCLCAPENTTSTNAPVSLTETIPEKAIRNAGLGLNPMNDGQLIRCPIPELNEERRAELVKVAAKYGEQARIAIRNVRKGGMDILKRMEKDKEISEDEHKMYADEVQELTNKSVKMVDDALATKEQEIMQV